MTPEERVELARKFEKMFNEQLYESVYQIIAQKNPNLDEVDDMVKIEVDNIKANITL
jgi:hypothetical protein